MIQPELRQKEKSGQEVTQTQRQYLLQDQWKMIRKFEITKIETKQKDIFDDFNFLIQYVLIQMDTTRIRQNLRAIQSKE